MRRYEALDAILRDTRDLLRGRYGGDRRSFQERVEKLMTVMGTGEDAAEDDRKVPSGSDLRREGNPAPATADQDAPDHLPHPFAPYQDLNVATRQERLDALSAAVRQCTRCSLAMGRTMSVTGEGVLDPLVMFVGEGPGGDEDRSGRPFVGAAGQYLDRWLSAIGLSRETNAYITNIVKCRPPNNRDPQPEESDACAPWLMEQIALVRPRMIVTLGRISTRILTGTTQGITRIHGTFYSWRSIPLVPTFHPSAVLRRDEWRRPVWEDLKTIRNWLVDNAGHRPPEDFRG